ncbi:MAG: hypothetical protein AB7G47_13260 [Mycolicibacterium sp.]|uniref:hypothetical protein n=1 Tax=Mycolicibacterium sp. TaxID=2320850 RepID=UPI003D0A5546
MLVARLGLLTATLGVGAAVAGGAAIAQADPSSGDASDQDTAHSSVQSVSGTAAGPTDGASPAGQDPASTSSALPVDKFSEPAVDIAAVDIAQNEPETIAGDGQSPVSQVSTADTVFVAPAPTDESSSDLADGSGVASGLGLDDVPHVPSRDSNASAASAIAYLDEPAVPSPDDQVTTEYGAIGKWMLEWDGDIADYGGLPYEDRTVLEPVNVIIVDPTAKTAWGAAFRLSVAMRSAGFPPRLFHSTGFRGLIDGRRYWQMPRGFLVGYSDGFFLLPNNHGRIFGPDPIETTSGYVWSGAFSTEEFVFHQGAPRHAYLSSAMARDSLVAQLVASGRATLGHSASLNNSFNTDTTTTGDHDGNAAVVILNASAVVGAAAFAATLVDGEEANVAACVGAQRLAAWWSQSSCAAVTATINIRRRGS